MFEEHRAHRAQKQYDEDRAAWESHVAEYRSLVDLASTFSGDTTSQLILEQGETVFFTVEDAELVEERRGPGSWHGRSQGVSIPIGSIGGRSVRYRVGASKGHFVQGEEQPTVIDRGTLYITSSRVVFQGGKQTRQCDLGKLVAVHHDPSGGILTMSVSNRQTPMVIRCGSSLSEALKFRLDLAIAHHNGTMPAFVDALRSDLHALEVDPPHPPSTAGPPVQSAPAVQPLSPAVPTPSTGDEPDACFEPGTTRQFGAAARQSCNHPTGDGVCASPGGQFSAGHRASGSRCGPSADHSIWLVSRPVGACITAMVGWRHLVRRRERTRGTLTT